MFKTQTWISDIEGLKGEIEFTLPNYTERINLQRKMNLKFTNGEVEVNDSTYDSMIFMREIVEKYVTKIDLSIGKNKIESLADLEYLAEFMAIVSKIGTILLNGVTLGNATKRP